MEINRPDIFDRGESSGEKFIDGDLFDQDLGEDGGPLNKFNPGKRIRDTLSGKGPDLGQSADSDEKMGPSALGRTPALGSLRRERGLPVIRDQIPSIID